MKQLHSNFFNKLIILHFWKSNSRNIPSGQWELPYFSSEVSLKSISNTECYYNWHVTYTCKWICTHTYTHTHFSSCIIDQNPKDLNLNPNSVLWSFIICSVSLTLFILCYKMEKEKGKKSNVLHSVWRVNINNVETSSRDMPLLGH